VRHESTHSTPAELFLNITGKGPLVDIVDFPPSSVISNIGRITIAREVQCTNAEKRREAHRRRINPIIYKIGDSVLVKTHKLRSAIDKNISKFFLLYECPFEISGVRNQNAYTLIHPESRSTRGTFNCIHLKKYYPPQDERI